MKVIADPVRRLSLILMLGACLVLRALPLAAQTLPEALPELETGGHRAVIRALVASADGTRLWSAGDDKTIREWSLTSAASKAVLRGQIGPGHEGTINALALSPDARWLAAGGYFAPHLSLGSPYGDVRIYDTATGRIARVLKGFDWVVTSLAYQPDRDLLAVSGQGGRIHLWHAPFSDAPQRLGELDTGASSVMALTFTGQGQVLAAATLDYGLHLFDMDSGAALEVEDGEPLWDTPVLALAPAPDGAAFALAADNGTVQIRSPSGALLSELPPAPFRPDALVWQNGLLTLACGARCGEAHGTVTYRVPQSWSGPWEVVSRDASLRFIRAATGLAGRAEIALAGGEVPTIRLTPDSGALPAHPVQLAGIGQPVTAVAISADGTRIAWGHSDPCPAEGLCPDTAGPLEYVLQLPVGDLAITPPRPLNGVPDDLLRAVTEAPGLSLSTGRAADSSFDVSRLEITRGGAALALERSALDGYYISAMGLVPGGEELITGGGNGILLAHRLSDGQVSGEFTGHTSDVLALAIAPEAGRMVTGGADQTLRLWDLPSRRLIASLFAAGPDWVMWTPEGYFHSSPDGDRLIGWHLNQGQDSEARFITARQLRQHLHSPEILRRALVLGDPARAAIELRGTDSELATLLSRPAPEFDLQIREDLAAPEGTAILEITGASLEEMEAWGFAVLVNDRRVPAQRIPPPPGSGQAAAAAGPAAQARFFYQIPVDDGENHILVSGEDEFGYVTERSGQALFRAPKVLETPGRLYVAVVGINRYPQLPDCGGRSCELDFPVADAIGFLRAVKTHSSPLFSDVETLVIATPEDLAAAKAGDVIDPAEVLPPDGRTITDELIAFLAKPGPEDTTIIFVASHGVNVGEDFFIVPQDAQMRGDDFRKSSLVDWSVIQEEIGYASGRRILMLDTCHAANAFNARLEKEAADARVIVFSATAANNTAQEKRDLGHGIFTWSVIQGLSGGASDGSGVRLLGLADYVYREVVRLSDGRQEPFYHISQTANFLLSKG